MIIAAAKKERPDEGACSQQCQFTQGKIRKI